MTRPKSVFRALLAVAAMAAAQSCTVKQNESPDLLGPSSLQTPLGPASPTARFTIAPDKPTANLPVAFDGSSSCPEGAFQGGCIPSDRTITSYAWTFGDGSTASGPTASHLFRTSGSFSVTLTVVTDRGLSSSASKSVSVDPGTPPTAEFVFSPSNPAIGQSVSFNAAQSRAGPGHTIASYSWDFGDGGKASGVNPSHSYGNSGGYSVVLTVTDEVGQTAAATKQVPVGATPTTPAPTADFVFSPTAPTVGQSVSFNASLSKAAPGHSIASYSWNFGDGGTESGVIASHTFGATGTYSVVLIVTDDIGQTATSSKAVPVATTSSGPPTAFFTFSPTAPLIGESVTFNASQSTAAPGRSIATYAWNFGDGTSPASGMIVSHTFNAGGTFNVVLVVTDDLQQTGTTTRAVTVPVLTANFSFSPIDPVSGTVVNFNANLSSPLASITAYDWDFGDGTVISKSGSQNFLIDHSFFNQLDVLFNYTVRLTVHDATGHVATTTKTVPVKPFNDPIAQFTVTPSPATVNQIVTFDGAPSAATSPATITRYQWDFGDGSSLVSTNAPTTSITHQFAVAKTYTIKLTVFDSNGRSASTSHTLVVQP